MRHFDFLTESQCDELFHRPPQSFSLTDDSSLLAVALGATLYLPASRPTLAADLAKQARRGVLSMVVCLEDAVADDDLPAAEQNVVAQLRQYWAAGPSELMIFIRVRTAGQIPHIVDELGDAIGVLAGFVIPKFTDETGPAFLDAIADASAVSEHRLLTMPVLESPEIIFSESRTEVLIAIRRLLDKYRSQVLAVRIGATDLSAAYGLRRSPDLTVYDVRVVADVIADIVNVLGRADGSGFVVTGPVWEYFSGAERILKPQLRESPFAEHAEPELRAALIGKDLDGLIREVALDKVNGLTGKAVIHPTHVAAVHALSVVTHEEYCDANDVLGTRLGGGVRASMYGNKMNESKPHSAWAQRIMGRAHVFGVARPAVSFVDLLGAGLNQ